MTTETSNARGEAEYEYEVWQGDALQAGGREADYASAQSEANHYAAMYAPDGPVEVRIYEKRLLSADKVEAKRRRYDPSGSLSEYGIFPECDAQPPADDDDEVVFIDGVGAARSSIKSCHDGVQWIKVGDRVYWPLSDSDAKRLHSACCGNGSFDGPTTPEPAEAKAQELEEEIKKLRREVDEWRSFAETQVEMRDEVEDHADALAKSLAELITWIPTGDVYRRLGFDPEAPMLALKRAKLAMGSMGGLHND